MNMITLAEQGWLPDSLIRFGIRKLCEERLRDEHHFMAAAGADAKTGRIEALRSSPIAIETEAANEQHYEVPTEFYRYVLGQHMKYSCSWWDEETTDLTTSEENMLAMYCERAQLRNGQTILELGCGWGSLSLWMASQYPQSQITAVSNSSSQRIYIESRARELDIENLQVITCDINELKLVHTYDRIVSIEMFEHVRNYSQLFANINHWLSEEGKLFVHIFCHRELLYPFETEGVKNWMGQYFFTGGLMPSADTFSHFDEYLQLEQQWDIPGWHYQKTSEAWLANMDNNKAVIKEIFTQVYGADNCSRWVQRWRMFFMSCAELFGYKNGQEWQVCHYLFSKNGYSHE